MRTARAHKGEKGVATILIVGVVAVFLIFFFVVIDFAYIYVVRGQLQNAADAGALAGAALILDPNDTTQTAARDEAEEFTAKNFAANVSVVVVTDGSNALSDSNDMTVGHFDTVTRTYTPGDTPVNAIQVRPRRTADSPGGPVVLFFGRLVGWPVMDVSRVAIAANPAVAEAPIALCIKSCDSGIINAAGSVFFWQSPPDEEESPYAIAFTDFGTDHSVSVQSIAPIFCGEVAEACTDFLDTTQSSATPLPENFRCVFLNPLYDSDHKTCQDGACDEANDIVTSWSPLVPIVRNQDRVNFPSGCPPGRQGRAEPYDVIKFARVKIIDVYIKDRAGQNVGGPAAQNCACNALLAVNPNGYIESQQGVAPGDKQVALIINGIDCECCGPSDPDCDDRGDIDRLLGKRSFLVK